MASLQKLSGGKRPIRAIDFTDSRDGKRKRIRLGKVSHDDALEYKRWIERLISAKLLAQHQSERMAFRASSRSNSREDCQRRVVYLSHEAVRVPYVASMDRPLPIRTVRPQTGKPEEDRTHGGSADSVFRVRHPHR